MTDNQQQFLRRKFEPKGIEEFRVSEFVPTAEEHDKQQKEIIIHYRNRLCNVIQKEVTSEAFFNAANYGEDYYIEKSSLEGIWKELDEKFGQRAEKVRKKLFSIAIELIKEEGYLLKPDTPSDAENFFTSDFNVTARYKLERIGGKMWLDKWLEANIHEDEEENNVEKSEN